MKRLSFVFGLVIWAVYACPNRAETAAPTMDQLLQESVRFPVIAVPLVEKEPTIDGAINDDEWAGASEVSDLIYDSANTSQRNGVAAQHRSRYFILYTKDALFVAARFEVPEYVSGPAISDVWSSQDVADIFLNPLGKFAPGRKWHISGAARGEFWWRDMSIGPARFDDAKILPYRARVVPERWDAEMRVPFKEVLNTGSPVPGEIWQANFVANRRTPIPSLSAWSYLKEWGKVWTGDQHGWLVFTGKPLGVRFDRGVAEVNRDGIQISLAGVPPASGVEAVAPLFNRKDRPTPHEMKCSAVPAATLKDFDPVGQPIQKQLSAADKDVQVKATELGEYLLTY